MRAIDRRGGVTLRVQLLGRVEVATEDGVPVRLGGRHAQALFALLVLSRRPRSRDALATDLWPDADGASSASLRQALWLVRNAFNGAGVEPDSILEVEPETIGLRPDARIELDAARFEACARDAGCGSEAAVELYRGDLAEGLGHECFAAERERLSDLYEDALAEAGEQRLRRADLVGARAAAERLLARDPLREEAHALIIEIHGLTGSRSQVVRQYRRLRAILARELDVEPLPETDVAYRVALGQALERSRLRVAALPHQPARHAPPALAVISG
jgi:DNA-binding SARP family transcriptional activator